MQGRCRLRLRRTTGPHALARTFDAGCSPLDQYRCAEPSRRSLVSVTRWPNLKAVARITLGLVFAVGPVGFVSTVVAAPASAAQAETSPPSTIPPNPVPTPTFPSGSGDTTAPVTPSGAGNAEIGAATPAPVDGPSAPLVQIPAGCPSPPVASIVFVGRMLAKDRNTARYRMLQLRAGGAAGYAVNDLIDIRYDDETQYLSVEETYLIGAAPRQPDLRLWSKVAEEDLLFGGDAVIGLTEASTECPPIEDPVRTLRTDGSDIESSMFIGLKDSRGDIALAFLKPLAVALAVIFALASVRWLFTAIFVVFRRAADGEGLGSAGRDRRRLPDL